MLQERFVDGSAPMSPGSKLSAYRIAHRFEVSRAPVRTAILRLAAEGYLVTSEGKGYRVVPLTKEDGTELCKLLRMISTRAAYSRAESAPNIREEAAASLRRQLDKSEHLLEQDDSGAWRRVLSGFYQTLVVDCVGKRFSRLHRTRWPQWERLLKHYPIHSRPLRQKSHRQRSDIVEGIQSNDASSAVSAVRGDFEALGMHVQQSISEVGERGTWP